MKFTGLGVMPLSIYYKDYESEIINYKQNYYFYQKIELLCLEVFIVYVLSHTHIFMCVLSSRKRFLHMLGFEDTSYLHACDLTMMGLHKHASWVLPESIMTNKVCIR